MATKKNETEKKPRTKKKVKAENVEDAAVMQQSTEKQAIEPLVFPLDEKVVVVINFNTPELTEAAIMSVKKHGGENYKFVVFDNSATVDYPEGQGLPSRHYDARPFTKEMENVTVIDNTKGQIIDFDAELAKYPDKNPNHSACNDWGSTKHIITVQKLWELIPNGFVLLESDVLVRKPINDMFDRSRGVIGHVQEHQPGNPFGIGRLMPLLCWMNVPMLMKCGAKYFDPERSWMLWPEEYDRRNWYDTGACLLEDVKSHMNGLNGTAIDIRPMMVHKQSGSWQNKVFTNEQWLKMNEPYWK